MKRLFTILFVGVVLFGASEAQAQLSKQEKKEWKKKMKSTSLEQFKNLVEENSSMSSQVASLRRELDNVDSQLAGKDSQINQFAAQVADLRDQLAKAKASGGSRGGSASSGAINDQVGIIFKVQIGAYEKIDLTEANSSNFGSEKGDLNKYTIGVFKDYWEADKFKKYIKEMGVKDAWIVSYKDGQRVDINQVLEGK